MPLVLIAEDIEDNRLMLKLLLETWNYAVVEAKNGEEAVMLAEQMQPDLILMDVRMPRLDGFEATRLIRRFSQVPVIFLSACAEKFYRDSAHSAGGDEYLTKPFDFSALEGMISKYVSV